MKNEETVRYEIMCANAAWCEAKYVLTQAEDWEMPFTRFRTKTQLKRLEKLDAATKQARVALLEALAEYAAVAPPICNGIPAEEWQAMIDRDAELGEIHSFTYQCRDEAAAWLAVPANAEMQAVFQNQRPNRMAAYAAEAA
jgi:hypothetical protein